MTRLHDFEDRVHGQTPCIYDLAYNLAYIQLSCKSFTWARFCTLLEDGSAAAFSPWQKASLPLKVFVRQRLSFSSTIFSALTLWRWPAYFLSTYLVKTELQKFGLNGARIAWHPKLSSHTINDARETFSWKEATCLSRFIAEQASQNRRLASASEQCCFVLACEANSWNDRNHGIAAYHMSAEGITCQRTSKPNPWLYWPFFTNAAWGDA